MKKHVQVTQSQVTFVCSRLPTLMLCVCLCVIWGANSASRLACKRPPPPISLSHNTYGGVNDLNGATVVPDGGCDVKHVGHPLHFVGHAHRSKQGLHRLGSRADK